MGNESTRGQKWVTWYQGIRDGLVAERGILGKSSATKSDMPRLTGTDALLVLSLITGPLAGMIKSVSQDGVVWPTSMVRAGGDLGLGTSKDDTFIKAAGGTVEPAVYLATGVPDKGVPYRRSLALKIDSEILGIEFTEGPVLTFEPARWNQLPLVQNLREAIISWQELIDVVVGALGARVDSLTAPMTLARVEALMSAFYRTMLSISAGEDWPPQSTRELAADAARHALREGSEALGKGAAAVAEVIGESAGAAAGGFSKGFFDNAGFTALVVTGAAIYLATR